MATAKIKPGDIVHIRFYDHAEGSEDAMYFETFGRVEAITRKAYQIYCWRYVKEVDRARDDNKENEDSYAVMKSAIEFIKVLK